MRLYVLTRGPDVRCRLDRVACLVPVFGPHIGRLSHPGALPDPFQRASPAPRDAVTTPRPCAGGFVLKGMLFLKRAGQSCQKLCVCHPRRQARVRVL